MKKLSTLMNESLNIDTVSESAPINECVVAARYLEINDDGEAEENAGKSYVLIKHRDRAYKVNSSIVHTVINGVEIAYLRDDDTLWSEGIGLAPNGNCLGIINASLSLADENMGAKKSSKGKDKDKSKTAVVDVKVSSDGEKIIKCLSMAADIEDAIFFAKSWKNGIHGNTIFATDDSLYSMASTSKHTPLVTKLDGLTTYVQTNHQPQLKGAGYTEGPSFKSSVTRQLKAEEFLAAANTPSEMLTNMRKQKYGKKSQLNPLRTTDTLATTSQMMIDPKNRHLHLVLMKDHTENFKGIVDQLPSGFEPKLKITFEEI